MTVFERMMGPRALFVLLPSLVIVGWLLAPRKEPVAEANAKVEGCWYNPSTLRFEPPSPWDPNYQVAAKAGELRALPRSALAGRWPSSPSRP